MQDMLENLQTRVEIPSLRFKHFQPYLESDTGENNSFERMLALKGKAIERKYAEPSLRESLQDVTDFVNLTKVDIQIRPACPDPSCRHPLTEIRQNGRRGFRCAEDVEVTYLPGYSTFKHSSLPDKGVPIVVRGGGCGKEYDGPEMIAGYPRIVEMIVMRRE